MLYQIIRAIHEHHERLTAIRHLSWLDDRLLADLGAERDKIEDFVDGRIAQQRPVGNERKRAWRVPATQAISISDQC